MGQLAATWAVKGLYFRAGTQRQFVAFLIRVFRVVRDSFSSICVYLRLNSFV
jgi:hypothetical protein